MRTVAETSIFQRYAEGIWSEEERLEFITWIALNPNAGALIPEQAVVERCDGRARGKASAVVLA